MKDTAGRRDGLSAVRTHLEAEAVAYVARVRSLVALCDAYGSVDDRDLLLGLAGSGRMGQKGALGVLERAQRLHDLYGSALVLLEQGRLFVHTVEWMLRTTKSCSEAVQVVLGQRLPGLLADLDAADVHTVLHRTIAEVTAELEAAEQQERHARALANRGVWVLDVEDGMSRVGAEVDALSARRFALDLDVIVQADKTRDQRDGVERTAAQRRADVLMDLPARYLALVKAIASGKADRLVAEARARTEAGVVAGGGPAGQPELPLGLPARCRVAEHTLDPDELLIELLRQPLAARTVLNVHVPMTSLLGLDQSPALVEGGGFLPAWMARLVAPDAGLRRVVVNAATGIPMHVDIDARTAHQRPPGGPDRPPGPGRKRPPGGPGSAGPGKPRYSRRSRPNTTSLHEDVSGSLPARDESATVEEKAATQDDAAVRDETAVERETAAYEAACAPQRAVFQELLAMLTPLRLPDTTEPGRFPSTRLRRLVEVRDQRCTGPGCRRQARLCELDHEHDHALGGPTSEANLSAKSPRCHHAKGTGWTVTRDPETGVSTWTSPTGETYTRQPAWTRHRTHPHVISTSPHPLALPTVETDYPADRPLWRPRYQAEKQAAVRSPAVPPLVSSAAGWDDEPPF